MYINECMTILILVLHSLIWDPVLTFLQLCSMPQGSRSWQVAILRFPHNCLLGLGNRMQRWEIEGQEEGNNQSISLLHPHWVAA